MQRCLLLAVALATLSLPSLGCRHNTSADAGDTGDMDGGTSSGGRDAHVDTSVDGAPFIGDYDGNFDANADVGGPIPGNEDTGTGGGTDTGTGGGTDTGTGGGTDTGTGGGTDTGTGSMVDANTDGGGFIGTGGTCTSDAMCAGGGRCVIVHAGGGRVCAQPCSARGECGASEYCAPLPGTPTMGVCAVLSTSLCSTCSTDAECGALGELCAIGPGDTANGCHTDCSIDVDACPTGYSCTTVGTRRVCAPAGRTCAAALGCTSGASCSATQMCCAGLCTQVDQTTSCGGCGTHCGSGEGCCGLSCRLLNTVMNCGACGNECRGTGTTGTATCNAMVCQLVCHGENWDVNGSDVDGCEATDTTPPGHTAASAQSRGSFNACDAMSMDSFGAHILSDARVHLPAIPGLDLAVGSTPDFWTVVATGSPPTDTGAACTQDFSATITTTGGSSTGTCYRLTVTGGAATYTADVSGSGSATVTHASPAYTAGATLTFRIEKTCSSATHENVSYTVSYHL